MGKSGRILCFTVAAVLNDPRRGRIPRPDSRALLSFVTNPIVSRLVERIFSSFLPVSLFGPVISGRFSVLGTLVPFVNNPSRNKKRFSSAYNFYGEPHPTVELGTFDGVKRETAREGSVKSVIAGNKSREKGALLRRRAYQLHADECFIAALFRLFSLTRC